MSQSQVSGILSGSFKRMDGNVTNYASLSLSGPTQKPLVIGRTEIPETHEVTDLSAST
jgi:hypothetical protein